MPTPELGEKQQKQNLDREIRDMINALTRRLAHLHKKPSEGGSASNVHDHDQEEKDANGGFGIITMAGSNEGATMRGELDLMSMENQKLGMKQDNEESLPPLTTCLNGNFQGVNNSIMVGGSYSTNDPGIHLNVDDHYEQHKGEFGPRKYGKKGKKKAYSESSKSDHSN
ncbi:unnamed protein product [Lactuca saligna]|uniref:Uncharacterized protein n=1 Tax=Lactuca saligna TaxID=75948 RepID=A0AA35ZUM7_LACSI|nr:unnamed protein product [Lactuca saligna]